MGNFPVRSCTLDGVGIKLKCDDDCPRASGVNRRSRVVTKMIGMDSGKFHSFRDFEFTRILIHPTGNQSGDLGSLKHAKHSRPCKCRYGIARDSQICRARAQLQGNRTLGAAIG